MDALGEGGDGVRMLVDSIFDALPIENGFVRFLVWAALSAAVSLSGIFLVRVFSTVRRRLIPFDVAPSRRQSLTRWVCALIFFLLFHQGVHRFGLSQSWLDQLDRVLVAAKILVLALLTIAIVEIALDGVAERAHGNSKARSLFVPFGRKFVNAAVALLAGVALLSSFGINVTALAAGLGLGGLVIALAAKDSVENLFGSTVLLVDIPFAVGDWVKIGDVEGVVEDINLRSTRIRTFQDSLITLPNSNLIKASVENFGARRYRRVRATFTFPAFAPAEGLDEFVREGRAWLAERKEIAARLVTLHVSDVAPVGITVLLNAFLDVPDLDREQTAREEILVHLLGIAQSKGLAIVFPPT